MSRPRVGVLGGTRFIGVHVVERLLAEGAEVSVFHRGRTREPRPFPKEVRRVLGERDRPESLAPFFDKPFDAVIDLSGYTPRHAQDVLAFGDRVGHYLFCSSTAVYRGPSPFTEDSPRTLEPGTYGGDKALAEEALFSAWRESGRPVTVFRTQGVFGPGEAPHALYVLRRLRARAPVLVRPDTLGKKLNFAWAPDLAACFWAALGRKQAFGRAYNVAGARAPDPAAFGALLARAAGEGPWNPVTLSPELARRFPELGLPWNAYDLEADGRRLAELGVTLTPLEEAARALWAWAKADGRAARLRRQRWEAQAASGRLPGPVREAAWRACDAARRHLGIIRARWT